MNDRPNSTPPRRTRGWLRSGLLGAALAFGGGVLLPDAALAQGGLDCSSAQVVTPGTITCDQITGTVDVGLFDCGAFGQVPTNGRWFSFTPATNGTAQVTSCGSGTDTQVAVGTGTCGSLTQVACNDDDADGCGSYSSDTEPFPVTGGTTYYIQWCDGWDDSGFTWDLVFTPGGAPSTCATATVVTPGSQTCPTITGVVDVGLFDCGALGQVPTNGQWFSFTPATNGTAQVTSCGSGIDTQVAVGTGTCGSLTQVACNDDDADGCPDLSSDTEPFVVTGGTTYYIQWCDGWDNSGFTWDLLFTPAPLCTPPTATGTVVADCGASTYTVDVDLTGLGDAPTVDIVSDVHGVIADDVTALGIYSTPVTAFGTPQTITVVHNGDGACNVVLGPFIGGNAQGVCQVPGTYPIPDDGCDVSNYLDVPLCISDPGTALGTDVYVNSVDLVIAHTYNADLDIQLINPNGTVVSLVSGRFGSGDNLGDPSNCPTTLFTLQDGGAPLSFTTTSNVTGIFAPEASLTTLHDGSDPNGIWILRVCDGAGADVGDVQFVELHLVSCLAPTATQTIVPACGTNEFSIDVDLTSLGTATSVDITNDQNGNVITATTTGIYTVGPFPSGSTVTVTLTPNDDAACTVVLPAQSFTCPPPNDDCSGAIAINCNSITTGSTASATTDAVSFCGTSLNTAPGVWYTVTGSGGPMTAALCGSAYDSKIGVFTTPDCTTFTCVTGEDDDFTNCGGNDPYVTWASTSGTTYYILVTGYSSNSGAYTLEVVCAGENTPPCQDNEVTVELRTDDFAGETSWEIIPLGNTIPVCSGSGYANNQQVSTTCCLIDGCYRLFVYDSFGDGMSLSTPAGEGGYRLFDANGERIIDNWRDGDDFTNVSSVNLGFCLPIGTDRVISTQCDKENWLSNEVIIASENGAVSAQWGIGDQTDDGYQFWFFNPDGNYNRRIFRNHATSGGNGPANALRASKLALNTIVSFPLPTNTLLNVRVRSRVNGVYSEWGPACRFMIDPAACTLTKLNDDNTSPNFSCGVTGKEVGASGNTGKVFAKVVTSGNTYATHYRFNFAVPGEGYSRNFVSTTAVCQLAIWQTNPLLCGTYMYEVRVQASFDGGTTYCPYGDMCLVTITNNTAFCTSAGSMAQQTDVRAGANGAGDFAMYPNPNRDGQLFLTMNGIPDGVEVVTVDIYDMLGQRATNATIAVAGGLMNTVLELPADMPAGVYMVNFTIGDQVRSERLVIQR